MSQTLFLLYRPEPARPMLKTRSVGAHSICARGSLSYRKRARADMESAPTFFVAGGVPPRRGRRPAWSCLPLLKAKSVGAHSICARGGLPYRKRTRADMESAPTFLKRQSTSTEAAPRVQFSPFVESEIRRGAFYMRPRRFILPQAGTGGYGIRPYVFFVAGGEGRVFACCACKRIYFRLRLVKNHLMWYTISLQVHRQTRCKPATQSYRGPSGQPVANKKLLFYCRR